MIRHKGARSDTTIDRDNPHQVEIEIPDDGLGRSDGEIAILADHGYR